MIRRWLVAATAVVAGRLVTVALLAYTGSQAATQDEVYVAVRDLPAGAPLAPDAVRLERVRLGAAGGAALGPGAARLLGTARAAHDLVAGQLVQRSDLAT